MTATLARRALLAIPTLLAATLLLFLLLAVGPDPLRQLQQEGSLTDSDVVRLTSMYGWDSPWYQQYGRWLGSLLGGDWGTSMRTGRPAWEMLAERIPISLAIGGAALLLSLLVAIPLALLLAARRDSRIDRLGVFTSVALTAVPGFLVAVLLQLAAVQLKDVTGHTVLHVTGAWRGDGAIEALRRFTLPVLTLTLVQVGAWLRLARAGMLDALGHEFVLAARAKGLPERIVLTRHALRSALAPLVTLVALDLGFLLGGAVIVENVFGVPGMGTLLLDSVQARDSVVALDELVLASLVIVAATLGADGAVAALDPRGVREGAR